MFQGRVGDELGQVMLIKWGLSVVVFTGDLVHDKCVVGMTVWLEWVQENRRIAFRGRDYWHLQGDFP